MDALDLWPVLASYNWAIKPRGTVFPYFCTVLKGDEGGPVKARLLLLEGWQTFHDFIRTRLDRNFGFYTTPIEFPHLELIVAHSGEMRLYRHDTGYMPVEANAAQRALAERILWESYGIMLRIETDRSLPLRYAQEKAVFARVERAADVWSDEPLAIPDPPPHVEKVTFPKADLKAVQDLPLDPSFRLAVDFRMKPNVMTKEPRPRCVYELVGIDLTSGKRLVDSNVSVNPEIGLKGLWESMPPQLLKEFIRLGRAPGELWLVSGRIFRLLRPLGVELPFKLSLHDSIPELNT